MSDVNELAKIRATVKRHRKLRRQAVTAAPVLWAECSPKWLAKRWRRLGFTRRQVEEWLSARCISPWTAAELTAAGVTPDMAARRTNLGRGSDDTIAFKCSTQQLSIVEAFNDLGISVLTLDDAEEQELISRDEHLDDALSRSTAALRDLHDAAAGGVLSPAEAGDAVFAVLTAIRQLSSVLSALGRETYRPLAQAVRDDLDRQQAAAGQALVFAGALDALGADLLAVHAQHYQALAAGTMATSDFEPRALRRHRRHSDPASGSHVPT